MMWRVNSKRLAWPAGTVLSEADLSACNIEALVAGEHLAPVQEKRNKRQPAALVEPDESAEEPEEQD